MINTSVDNIPADCDIAVVQAVLADRARKSAPQAQLVIINNFLQDPNLDGLYEQMTAKVDASAQTAAAVEEVETPVATGNTKILVEEGIKTGLKPVDKFEAIKAAGKLLNELGYVEEGYIDAMVKREETVTTYMGLGVAIPHGTGDAKKKVQKTGIVMLQYPEGVDFDGEKAQLVFGIAGIGDEHLGLLAKISEIIEDPERLEQLKTTKNVDENSMEMFKIRFKQKKVNLISGKFFSLIKYLRYILINLYFNFRSEENEESNSVWSRKYWTWIYRWTVKQSRISCSIRRCKSGNH